MRVIECNECGEPLHGRRATRSWRASSPRTCSRSTTRRPTRRSSTELVEAEAYEAMDS